jgi:hypothetical protein
MKGRHMARALMGHVGTYQDQALAYELARLRRRVSELETELAQLKQAADRTRLDLELHRMAQVTEVAEAAALA